MEPMGRREAPREMVERAAGYRSAHRGYARWPMCLPAPQRRNTQLSLVTCRADFERHLGEQAHADQQPPREAATFHCLMTGADVNAGTAAPALTGILLPLTIAPHQAIRNL